MKKTALFLAALFAFGAGPAVARDVIYLDSVPVGAAMARAVLACAHDAERLCPDTPRGGGRVVACLAAHSGALSAPCADELAKAELLVETAIVCAADTQQFCAHTPPGGGRMVSCLVGNQDRISDACYGSLAASVEAYGGIVN